MRNALPLTRDFHQVAPRSVRQPLDELAPRSEPWGLVARKSYNLRATICVPPHWSGSRWTSNRRLIDRPTWSPHAPRVPFVLEFRAPPTHLIAAYYRRFLDARRKCPWSRFLAYSLENGKKYTRWHMPDDREIIQWNPRALSHRENCQRPTIGSIARSQPAIATIDLWCLQRSTPSTSNRRHGAHGRRYFNEPRRIVFRIIKSHPSVDDEGYISEAAARRPDQLTRYWSYTRAPFDDRFEKLREQHLARPTPAAWHEQMRFPRACS